jgi:hypothetical protein
MSVAKPKPIRWLHAARDDFAGIIDEILADHPHAAEKWANRIFEPDRTTGDVSLPRINQFPHAPGALPGNQAIRDLLHGSSA